jgi:FMN reductase (NADPH)
LSQNPIIDVLMQRVSLRKYAERSISQEHKEMILNAAMRAPTAGNMMMYSVIVIENQDTKDTLSKTCDNQPFIAEAPLIMIFAADLQRWYDYFELSSVGEYCKKRGLEFTGPSVAELFLGCSDALIAAQNAVIAAESLGIGSCYIGDIMENYEIHRDLLALPPYVFPIAMLCLGYYPKGKRLQPKERFDTKYIVSEERYQRLEPVDLKAMFAQRESRVMPGNPYEAENFGQFMYARKLGTDFAREMSRSIKKAMEGWYV